ncbi:FAD-dependent monooxygenase [Nonomuraea polychroma]|uniref:FAD-dependent monooxygenase n=1 Tax=Nonomuraea polychroma TaxID=46176 RepID=UPI003D8CC01A
MDMTLMRGRLNPQVIVAGAGPTGLMLAGDLALAGVAVFIVDRLPRSMTQSRASQLNTRTAEILRERALHGLLEEARQEPRAHFGGISFDLPECDSPYAGNWKVPQYRTEAVLARRALRLGAVLLRSHEVCAVADLGDHVVCELDGPAGRVALRASYLVGCDGADSTVRRLAGFTFPEAEATRELLRADVTGVAVPERRFQRFEHGLAVAATQDNVSRVMVHVFGQPMAGRTEPPRFAEIAQSWAKVTGDDISAGQALWTDSFHNAAGQVTHYRQGRVLLAGDAAHRHLPISGQSLNLGLQDAVNLGWRLAQGVHGWSGDELLDGYHAERHPVGGRIMAAVAAQEALLLGGHDMEPLRELFAELLASGQVRGHLGGLLGGLDIRYGDGRHPQTGRRMPLAGALPGPAAAEAFTHLAHGRGVLLHLAATPRARSRLDRLAAPWGSRVGIVHDSAGGAYEGLHTLLLRPDGHIGWADLEEGDLVTALRGWFGSRPDTVRSTGKD